MVLSVQNHISASMLLASKEVAAPVLTNSGGGLGSLINESSRLLRSLKQ